MDTIWKLTKLSNEIVWESNTCSEFQGHQDWGGEGAESWAEEEDMW